MGKTLQNIILGTVISLLVTGAVANVAISAGTCLKRACCCAGNSSPDKAAPSLHTSASPSCQGKAPCCQLAPIQPKQDLALAALPQLPEPWAADIVAASTAEAIPAHVANQRPFNGRHEGPPVPLVALYLQILTILC